ncbi:MAG: diguanylate cyclase [Desulfocapsaceae bacterium]|nr:diguanylate cyclase [Desulfocapsaceae bacterium]
MRILIAEDDLTSRQMLAGVLRKAGHDVLETVNGLEAWNILQDNDAPRLAILDWVMPELDGLEVIRRVRALLSPQPPYLIMLTTKGEKTDIIAGLDAGANDYLAKPFDIGELRARVEVGRRMVELQEALVRSREALFHQATHDPLTGMMNRRAILDQLDRELARAKRRGEALAVGMCDIDFFKKINDTYGHHCGDDVLCRLAQILKDSLRTYDSVGRLGGEEFLMITPIEDGVDAVGLYDRICRGVAESSIATRSGEIAITVSIGVAAMTPESSVDKILEEADRALYQAKNNGRNRVIAKI